MNSLQPKISVVMTVYNQKIPFLTAAIESVLKQTYADFEFLILNDGSNDPKCSSLLEHYAHQDNRIRLISNAQNMGIIKTRNIALRAATGNYVAILDSDDLASKNRLEVQLDFMEANPAYALCGSWANIINGQGLAIGKKKSPTAYDDIRKKILTYNFFTHSACFFKKETALALGGYNESAVKSEDYDLILKLAGQFPVAIIPQYLCSYRINTQGDSLSGNKLSQKNSLKTRLTALQYYGYPKIYYLKLIIPLFMYLFVPTSLKQLLLKQLWKKSA